MSTIIEMKSIVKEYKMGEFSIKALKGIDLHVNKSEFVAVMGASGSGKSTLMNILGCLDVATSGNYQLENVDVNSLTKDQFSDIRNQKIGFVFQGFNLLPRTSALENVELPLFYNRTNKKIDQKKAAIAALERVGLAERIHHVPSQLSGGQQQRVAIARALVTSPSLILADEPTGNLDTATSLEIMLLFQELNRQGITIILVTHEQDIAQFTKRNVVLRDGCKIIDKEIESPDDAITALEDLKSQKLPHLES